MKKVYFLPVLFFLLFLFSTGKAFAITPTPSHTAKAKVMKQGVLGAKAYNNYYKETGDKKFTHSVRRLPQNFNDFTISSLKSGVGYSYVISALNENGKEFWFSSPKTLPVK